MTWRRALEASDVPPGHTRSVDIEDEGVLICRTPEGALFALEDRCSHDGSSFENGALDGTVLTCPRHGARFDVINGAALSMPAVAPVETYPVRESGDGWIEVDVDS
jgi:nitrite reductase/ring-hydroxylating ferredoxin subunit